MGQRFFFCPKCGARLEYRPQDGRPRLTCLGCRYIFYENPAVGVAAIVLDPEQRLLLGRRTTTYRGRWCIPCGYVEYDEDVCAAVVREFREETGLEIAVTGVYAVHSNFHNPEKHSVGIWFQADVIGGRLQPGDDLDAVGYFPLDDLPPLAFETDRLVISRLRAEFEDHY